MRKMNKRGGFVDLFLLIILSFMVVLICGVFIFVGTTTSNKLHEQLDNQSTANVNYTTILQGSIDQIPVSYQVLKWGSALLIFGMIISIFMGSYMVTTKPIYFIPYIIILFVAIILSVVVANAYDDLLKDNTLGATLSTFTASNFFLLYLPFIVGIVGIVGGVIMYASYKLGSGDQIQL